MSDLIDRSEVLKAMDTWDKFGYDEHSRLIKIDRTNEEYVPYVHYDDIVKCVNDIPTAYDIDKVIEELEKQAENTVLDFMSGGYVAIDKAIEIVKQGSVTKNCNNCANYTESDEVDNGCYLCCKGYEDNYEPKVDNGGVGKDAE